jgi:hypothetical protein
MVAKLIAAWPLEHYEVWVAFADGTEGAVDLEKELASHALHPLKDLRLFRKVRIDRGLNLLAWPNGTGVDPSGAYRELRRRQRPARRRHPAGVP